MAPTLAIFDPWQLGFFALQFVLGVFQALTLFWLKANRGRMDELQNRVEAHAEALIDQKFSVFNEKLDAVLNRLDRGDVEFKSQHDRDHALELKFITSLTQLQSDMTEKLACREELLKLTERVQGNELALAKLQKPGGDA